ncbi:DNA-(apurinic or apyrimidinic site) endonuclease 2-like [Asterias amurensis]|uniref:DNA-(apurinic or apyrimidinic site) endonuclease 2-like n=1 Tax=Asterias amurensis TaxID=7602 RepID=UPI003AB8BBE9
MDILTWNINGIRASKIPIKELLDSLGADVICLQETKVTRDLLDDAIANIEGYSSYFSYSRKRSGYSGVATYCRDSVAPVRAEEGLTGRIAKASDDCDRVGCYGSHTAFTDEELQSLDSEGRAVMTQHRIRTPEGAVHDVVVINVYCPRADRENKERMLYKLQFYNLLQLRAEALVHEGRHVVIVGDINASHRRIDNCDPGPEFELHPSRQWLNSFLCDGVPKEEPKESETSSKNCKDTEELPASKGKFVDTFRLFHPNREKAFTCWSTMTGARQTNYGTRIDYIFADLDLCSKMIINCDIMPEVEGSDHCPVKARLKCEPVPSEKLPQLSSSNMPEFSGKQMKLMSFFQKLSPSKVALARQAEADKIRDADKTSQRKVDNAKSGLKRLGNDLSSQQAQKKQKTGTRQQKGSLMNFFVKKKPQKAEVPDFSSPDVQVLDSVSKEEQNTESKYSETASQESQVSASQESHISSEGEPTKDSPPKDQQNTEKKNLTSWKKLFSGPPPPPRCKGHNEPCLLRTVKKPGPNLGRKFFVCPRPEGHKNDPNARCNSFSWVVKTKLLAPN